MVVFCEFEVWRLLAFHDDVITWKHLRRDWSFMKGIHRSPTNSPNKGQWRGALIFLCACANDWANHRCAGDRRRHRAHYDVTVICIVIGLYWTLCDMCLLPDTLNSGLCMRWECRECFPCHRWLVIPTCIKARAWRTCRDACRDC